MGQNVKKVERDLEKELSIEKSVRLICGSSIELWKSQWKIYIIYENLQWSIMHRIMNKRAK